MNVGEMCNHDVVVAVADASISEAARLMRRHHVGDVLVLDPAADRIPIGIITDRDIVVEVLAAGLDPAALTLRDVIASPLITTHETETCEDTVRLMALHGVRRMPVVDGNDRLVGVITLDDLLPHFSAPLAQLSTLASRGRRKEIRLRK